MGETIMTANKSAYQREYMRQYRKNKRRRLREKENVCADCVQKLATLYEWILLSYAQKMKKREVNKHGD
jgi:hypothetical protein